MKKLIIFSGVLWLAGSAAQATVYSYNFNSGFANGGVVPDGNVTGWSDNRSVGLVSDFGPLRESDTTDIRNISVRLNVSGGYNGDLYGYLVHSSGFAVLLNRSGKTSGNAFGSGDAGYNLTLDDNAANGDIHLYQLTSNPGGGVLTGSWAPDGRNINPATVVDTDGRTATLSSFNGLGADGTWTLFLADMSGGDVSTLNSWGLDITVVPEPTTWALIGFGAIFLCWQGWRYVQRRQATV